MQHTELQTGDRPAIISQNRMTIDHKIKSMQFILYKKNLKHVHAKKINNK